MKKRGGRGAEQFPTARDGLHASVSSSLSCAIILTHSNVFAFILLVCCSLSLQPPPAGGVLLCSTSHIQDSSRKAFLPLLTTHIPPRCMILTLDTPSHFSCSSLSASSAADTASYDVLANNAAVAAFNTAAAAARHSKAASSTRRISPAATGRSSSSVPASPSCVSAATGASASSPPSPLPFSSFGRSEASLACIMPAVALAFEVTAGAPVYWESRSPKVVDCLPRSSPAYTDYARSDSLSGRLLHANAHAVSFPRGGIAAGAPRSRHAQPLWVEAPASAAVKLWRVRQQRRGCLLHATLSVSRRWWPARQELHQSLCGFLQPSLSHCVARTYCAPHTPQQQQQPWGPVRAAALWCARRGTRNEDVWVPPGGGRQRSRNNRNCHSRVLSAVTSSGPVRRGWRAATALFDSQEERFSALKSLKEQETPKFQAEDWTTQMPLLDVKDLHVVAVEDGQEILKGVNLTVMPGEVHAVMGRNGSGKSTLSKVLAGYPSYKVTRGSVRYKGLDLLELAIDNRGLAGLFLAFQYPIEIPMVSNLEFLRVAYNERRKWRGEEEVDSVAFRAFVEEKLQEVGLDPSFLSRPLNYGFSGGEKKRNEILQMIILDPELVMLDETDSGLDVDSFNVTAAAIKRFAARKNKSFLVTTHYKKLLDVLLPDKIHVMHAGRVILSGDMSLASRIEKEGFASLISDDPCEEMEAIKGLARGLNLLENDEAYEAPSLSPSAAGGGRRDLDKLL